MKQDVYSSTEDAYINVKARILGYVKEEPSTIRTDANPSWIRQIQLPKINLPSFSGEQLEWESFRDLFRSLVDSVPGGPRSRSKTAILESKFDGRRGSCRGQSRTDG